ncbi:uncharacterized protein NECHADRAFT_77536 [Fusarium vanettenii 77-13-4]|uniref:Uncharacterized protein n=1 Tax=Fusarium vanettenii (strain ATCC MYA-4622 / CBS 123669 / FGSC 9596 / NRRL 45880 / 77-13-4) TaxID=660122 RepID=C7YLH8_FUSV7|nr:uncharacterized protein NECHADRAFT_77536 [Fusarium vanettenii 77-13-4]EEU47265.1 predicted protein [Fusarium vanettenii 77-13-4]
MADSAPSVWSGSTTTTYDSSSEDSLANKQGAPRLTDEEDPLIPNPADVHRTFCDGKATWNAFLDEASRIPSGLWPVDALDPYITLVDVPSLPEHLPRSAFLYGRPCWELPLDIGGTVHEQHPDSNVALVHGYRAGFRLGVDKPLRCHIRPDIESRDLGIGSETTNSLGVLVMCWSYILSVRLLEMQGRPRQRGSAVDLDLEGASPSLIRWLCAILSPKMGWRAMDLGKLPPWATYFNTGIKISIRASDSVTDMRLPPTSSEATELLIELCRLFNLGADSTGDSSLQPMPLHEASFMAALVIPFYTFMRLQPRLPRPHLTGPQKNGTFSCSHEQSIRGYLSDMRYFMALSAYPPSIGTIIWSILWQPDVDCNLVGPWLAAVLDTLEPALIQEQLELIAKVFISRRPRVAIWWVALFLLGDPTLLNWIQRYTMTMEEKYGSGSLSPPDPMVSAWTGSKQSFMDLDKDSLYTEPSDQVSRADLLRCRFDLKLQDSASATLAWRPFGYVQKGRVELELWPQLETKYTRKYHSFTWYIRKKAISDKGFRACTGRMMSSMPDNLEMRTSAENVERDHQAISVRPSKKSTLKMMSFLVEDAAGGRNWANADMPGKLEQHRWLRDWEGLYSMDEEIVEPDETPTKPASWFLEEWIEGKY